MVYVRMAGHSFLYELEDVIRLFFGNEEVIECETQPPADSRGIFIYTGISLLHGVKKRYWERRLRIW